MSAENRRAESAIGFGGLEPGRAIGGDERCLLTLGVVFGGSGTSPALFEDVAALGEDSDAFGPCGISPEPMILGRRGAFMAIEPFLGL